MPSRRKNKRNADINQIEPILEPKRSGKIKTSEPNKEALLEVFAVQKKENTCVDDLKVKVAKDTKGVPSKRKKKIGGEENKIQKEMRESIGKKVLDSVKKSKKLLGVHASAAGGLEQAIFNARAEGCQSFALFLRNQRRWDSKPLEEEVVVNWWKAIKETQFPLERVVPHGSYLMNPGSYDEQTLTKTRVAMLEECQRAEKLGITLYNFHPGSSVGKCTTEECIARCAETIDYVVERTENVIMVVETMAGQGNTIGGKFEELRDIIDKVKNKDRIGVCIDTCHIFAAGYDIRKKESYDDTMRKFGEIVGFEYLKAIHLNDSKADLGSHLDRHENIGKGKLKEETFSHFMNDTRLDGIPMILETPEGMYPEEMILLYELDNN
ncbi:unnamed protein product [Caenorhabditis auriculariae]|uniref:Xylose isomerase-like TIM barrel domain-containing protein n=1 Tax=Caenorhabditis auriculariae TaxID=2777116 RepID=A0A8S1HG61_9PELO|nr:unnamed protein product [Caenorhabditis auriculariae]